MSEKSRIRQSFSAAANGYDKVAGLQREVGAQLLRAIDPASLGGTLLDLGCGTGFLTGELLALPGHGQVIALDLALSMLQAAQAKLQAHAGVHYVCADAESLPFADHSVDQVFSNLALQWCGQLDAVFTGVRRVLKPGGRLVFSTFGANTLKELKLAWASVDSYSHVNEFQDINQLQQALQQAGFKQVQLDSRLYLPHYDNVLDLMRELKQLGAHHVVAGRNRHLTGKARMQAMMAAYRRQCGEDELIPASFEVITVTAAP